MKAVLLSDGESNHGAAISAARLAEGLCAEGVEVTRIVGVPDRKPHPWKTIPLGSDLSPRGDLAFRLMEHLLPHGIHQRLRNAYLMRRLSHHLAALRPDVINVHSLGGVGWPPEILRVCGRHAPVVWTLHDMWSVTGGCTYSYGCANFATECGVACKDGACNGVPAEMSGRDLRRAWVEKHRTIAAQTEMIAVSPSEWLAREAIRGGWSKDNVRLIPYGLPLDTYRRVDRKLARTVMRIEPEGPVLLYSATTLGERRKGGHLFRDALEAMQQPVTILVMGRGSPDLCLPNVKVHSLGFVDHELLRALAYCAADACVHPATADNLPNVVLESIACGTPVIGFPVGGVPDMVREGRTGWLASEITASSLAETMNRACKAIGDGCDLGMVCRETAERDYDSRLQASRYLHEFGALLERKKPCS